MDIKIENLEKAQIKITVSLNEKEMDTYKSQALKALQDHVKVDGFRPGHIPMEMIINKIGQEAFMGQVLDMAIGETYEKTIIEKDLKVVDYPKLNVVSHDPLKYEATVAILPEVEWTKDLSKLELKRKAEKVSEKEVEEVLQNLQSRSTKWNDVERTAKKGDRVELDFEGFDMDGIALEGTASKNHPVILGSGSLIPGFEDEIEGMKKDEEKEFDIVFPKDYHSEKFKSKKVKFKVKLLRIEEPLKPEVNDEFANEITGGHRKTLKELKEEILEELGKQKERQEELQLETDFIKELPKYAKAEISESLLNREIDFMIERMKEDLTRKGKSWEDYEKEVAESKKDIRKELEATAKEQVLIRLALESAYEKEKIEVSHDEVHVEIDKLIQSYPPQLMEMARQRFEGHGEECRKVENQLRLRKLVLNHVK